MLLLQEYMMIKRLIFGLLKSIDDETIVEHIKNEIDFIDKKLKSKREGIFTRKRQRLLSGDGIRLKPFDPAVLKWD